MPLVEIDPRIPDKVGCTAVTMRPMIKNKGCWEIEMSWTVTAEGAGKKYSGFVFCSMYKHSNRCMFCGVFL